MSQSGFESLLVFQIKALKLEPPVVQHRFCERRWTFDMAWPAWKLALEVEGGIWTKGRHTRGLGYEKDCEKYNAAALAGWRVLRVTTAMVKDGRAIKLVQRGIQMARNAA